MHAPDYIKRLERAENRRAREDSLAFAQTRKSRERFPLPPVVACLCRLS